MNPKIKIPNQFKALAVPLFNLSIPPTAMIDNGIVKKGNQFIMTAGIPVGITGTTNMIKIEMV